MHKERGALLIATLAGLVIVGAAALVVQPSLGDHPPSAIHLTGASNVALGAAAFVQPA